MLNCGCLVSIPLISLQFTEPFQRGFFPGDNTIAYPMRPDTISMALAAFIGLSAPLLPMFILEIYLAYRDNFPRNRDSKIPLIFFQLYKYIGCAAFSFISLMLIVNVGKETFGSLRPFFLEACIPANNTGSNFQTVINCTSDDARIIEEARVSFPSGHSACMAWAAAMTIFYLQIRFPKSQFMMLKSFYEVAIAIIAYYVCLTRIQDNRHRSVDVITGAVLGVLSAAMIFLIPSVQWDR
nr:phosphatidate phosphatase [Hymenolepis microstoma]